MNLPVPITGGSQRGLAFEWNVFINCPFDDEYVPLLRPLLFTVVYLGFNPRIASERSDSGENRVDKIADLIRESRYSIHDLSRLKSQEADEFYRLNMPFEFGFDYGARRFGTHPLSSKKCLILERSLYDFRRALSDVSGVDVKAHRNRPEEVVRATRDWFVETVGVRGIQTGTVIWYRFNFFTRALYELMTSAGSPRRDIDQLPIPEYVDYARAWVQEEASR